MQEPKGRGRITFFEIRALNYFGCLLQLMFNFPEIFTKNVYDCGSKDHEGDLCVIINLDIKGSVWEGNTASQDKKFRKLGC